MFPILKSTKSRVIAAVAAMMVTAGAITTFMLTGADPITLPPASAAIIGVQAPLTTSWFDTNEIERVKLHVTGCTNPPPTSDADLNKFVLDQYYDLTMTAYIAAQRTGDSVLLAAARKCADSWWQHPQWIGSGTIRKWPDEATPQPRHAGIGGLSLRALDGRPEMWPWIVGYTQFHLDLWLKRRINDPQLYYGLREGAFALHYAVWVARTLPDSYPNAAQVRAQLITDIDNVVINYFARLQQPDGSWRWDTAADEFVDTDGGTLKGIMQPFMVGLLLGALTDAYSVVTPAGKESIKQQMAKACRHLFEGGPYIKDQVVPNFNVKVRGFHYFYHGGTSVNPTRYATGDIPPNWNTPEKWHVESARQAISTILPAYGFVYTLTGDPWFKAAGDELFDSAYGGGDGFRAMAADTAKNYNQHYRLNGRYLVWRGGAPAPLPTATLPPSPSPSLPTPTVTPTATPTPTVAPTATPTPVPTVTPRPSPTPLPFCASGQRPGNPPVCRCRNGMLGNSGKCR